MTRSTDSIHHIKPPAALNVTPPSFRPLGNGGVQEEACRGNEGVRVGGVNGESTRIDFLSMTTTWWQ
jgi:hypothetical protein